MFRPATNADGQGVREMVFRVFEEFGFDREPTDTDLDDIEGSYLAPGGLFEVVERHGQIVGSAGIKPVHEGVCELRKMYLAREVRGCGLGKQLLERMIEAARARGFRRMELETASCLVDALRLYQGYGFSRFQKAVETDRCDLVLARDL